jgi:hypothetical protein
MKESILCGIFDILHWASWVDYIVYIGLTAYVGTQYDTILFILTEWYPLSLQNLLVWKVNFIYSNRMISAEFALLVWKVNFDKSFMVPINMSDKSLDILTNTLGCSLDSLPFTYLGVPLSITRHCLADFWPLVFKCEKRLAFFLLFFVMRTACNSQILFFDQPLQYVPLSHPAQFGI